MTPHSFRSFFKGFKKGMREAGLCSAMVINSMLLLVVYFVAVGVTALIARISGKRFMETTRESFRDSSRRKKSYWSDLNLKTKPLNEYYRQF